MSRLAGLDQFVGDAACLIDRDGETEADGTALGTRRRSERGDRRVDADQLAVHVDEGAAGVAGVDRCVGLQSVDDGVLVAGLAARGHRAIECGDDAFGDRAGKAERGPDGHNLLSDLNVAGVPEIDGGEVVAAVDLDDGDVRDGIGTDKGGRGLGSVGERDAKLRSLSTGNVVVGQDQTVGGQDDTGTLTALSLRGGHLDLHDARHHLRGNGLNRAGGSIGRVGRSGLRGVQRVGDRRGSTVAVRDDGTDHATDTTTDQDQGESAGNQRHASRLRLCGGRIGVRPL
ncbi:hypothetical protein M2260_000942 [Rhodococcus erythropolis]|nr:hypothetical protein [Rhodococcus erythropolis]